MGARESVGEGMSELIMGFGVKPFEGSSVLMVPVIEGSTEVVTDWRVVAVESYEVYVKSAIGFPEGLRYVLDLIGGGGASALQHVAHITGYVPSPGGPK